MHARTSSRLLAAALSAGLLLTACGGGGEVAADDVRARAQLESVGRSAVYLDITNDTEDDVELVAAEVPAEVAGYTELHETVAVDEGDMADDDMADGDMADDEEMADGGEMEGMGGMEMRQVSGIPVPAGETVSLEPGGLHIMLLDLAADLTDGQTFDVVLEFADGSTQTVEASVTTTP